MIQDQKFEAQKKEISSGIIIFRRAPEGIKFLLLYHGRGYWNFPKGKLEKEERSIQAAFREVQEETGLRPSEIRLVRNFRVHEKFTFYRKDVHGHRNRIFKVVILFLAETRISQVRVSDEHDGYGWFTFGEAKKMLSKFKEHLLLLERVYSFLKNSRAKYPSVKPKINQKPPVV